MEDLALSYQFVLHFCEDLRAGQSARASQSRFLAQHEGEFCRRLALWMQLQAQGRTSEFRNLCKDLNVYQESLFEVLSLGAKGSSILDVMDSLELEMRKASEEQLQSHLSALPFKMMLPLLLFQFPALLLLMVGPFILQLLREVG